MAFVAICIMMMFVFGGVKIGFLAMLPNIWPVLLILGFMGWTGVPLDFVKLLIACIAIGIAVDDTIHFITRYLLEYRLTGDYPSAQRMAFLDVGRAMFYTTVVLTAGFLVNLFSVITNIVMFGVLTAGAILVALLADYFLAPALILTFKPFREDLVVGREKEENTPERTAASEPATSESI